MWLSELAKIMFVFLLCGVLSRRAESLYNIDEKYLRQTQYCSKQVLMEEDRYRLLPVRSKLDCAMQCRQDDRCVSLVYHKDSRLCQLAHSFANGNCSNMEASTGSSVFYQQPLPCGEGEVTGPRGLCICAPGFAGIPCTRYIHDCDDAYNYGGWSGDGIYTVQPLNFPEPFEVYCRYITHARLSVMVRKKKSGREDFDRPWADYRDGFGKLKNDFWIGLEKLHALTSADRSYKLRVNIKLVNTSMIVHSYDDFKVTDQSSGYRLQFNASYLNGLNDCFMPLLNAPFSTYDHDRDNNDDMNCAEVRKGGFWYHGPNCSTCNPHGIIYGDNSGLLVGAEDEAFWDCLGNVAPYKIYMYIVPIETA